MCLSRFYRDYQFLAFNQELTVAHWRNTFFPASKYDNRISCMYTDGGCFILHREGEQRNRPRKRESSSPTSYSTTPTVAPPPGGASAARHSPWWAPNRPHPQISMVTHRQTLSVCVICVLVVNPHSFLYVQEDKQNKTCWYISYGVFSFHT